jgi:hypothetical protein
MNGHAMSGLLLSLNGRNGMAHSLIRLPRGACLSYTRGGAHQMCLRGIRIVVAHLPCMPYSTRRRNVATSHPVAICRRRQSQTDVTPRVM